MNLLWEKEFAPDYRFQVVEGDLLKQEVDGIVNAANGYLQHGGGVAGIIARAAGAKLVEQSQDYVSRYGPLAVGQAVLTTAGKLPFKGVIHAVGPVYGQGNEAEKLKMAMLSAFRLADSAGWKTLAFPAVSAGIFAVPAEICAQSYLQAGEEFFARSPENLHLLRLVLLAGNLQEKMLKVFQRV